MTFIHKSQPDLLFICKYLFKFNKLATKAPYYLVLLTNIILVLLPLLNNKTVSLLNEIISLSNRCIHILSFLLLTVQVLLIISSSLAYNFL
jgi:hypothetical protein